MQALLVHYYAVMKKIVSLARYEKTKYTYEKLFKMIIFIFEPVRGTVEANIFSMEI